MMVIFKTSILKIDRENLFPTMNIIFSSIASKPSNIRWIGTGPYPCRKIMNNIVLQTIFHIIEIKNKN